MALRRRYTKNVLNEVLNQIPMHIFWKDRKGVYLGCNKLFAESFNLSPEHIIGKTDYDLPVKKADSEKFIVDDMEVVNTGHGKINIEEKQTLPDGSLRYLQTSKVPLIDKRKSIIGILGIYSDITEKKLLQQSLISSNNKLTATMKEMQHANHQREKTLRLYKQFVEDQEHDIRTPLGNVAAGAKYVLDEIQESREMTDDLLFILEGISVSAKEILDYQESLVFDLYEGQSTGRTLFARFDLPDIVRHAYEVNLGSARYKQLDYRYEYDSSIPNYIVGDSKRVYQCLVDLLSNAVRFTPSGSVHLNIECLNQTEREVIIRFSVIDTGIGIPKDKYDDIYDAFVKAKPSNKGGERGRGLGLTRVSQFVSQMEGEIRFDSEINQGTCFHLVIPFKISLDQTQTA